MAGLNEFRIVIDIINESLLVFAHFEEIIFLRHIFQRLLMLGTFTVFQLFFSVKPLTAHAVITTVFAMINITRIIDFLQHLLYDLFMTIFGCANKIIVFDVQFVPQFQELGRHIIAVFLRVDLLCFRRFLYFLSVLVKSGQKECIGTNAAVIACQYISQNSGIGMPDMGFVIHIIDRRGNIKFLLISHYLLI